MVQRTTDSYGRGYVRFAYCLLYYEKYGKERKVSEYVGEIWFVLKYRFCQINPFIPSF